VNVAILATAFVVGALSELETVSRRRRLRGGERHLAVVVALLTQPQDQPLGRLVFGHVMWAIDRFTEVDILALQRRELQSVIANTRILPQHRILESGDLGGPIAALAEVTRRPIEMMTWAGHVLTFVRHLAAAVGARHEAPPVTLSIASRIAPQSHG